jgi:hypothetical protein
MGAKRTLEERGLNFRSWHEADLSTYFCNVRFWEAECPPLRPEWAQS